MDGTNEGVESGQGADRLVFSSYGHVIGLADGVLFGTGQRPRKTRPAAAGRKAPPDGPDGKSGQSPDADAPGS